MSRIRWSLAALSVLALPTVAACLNPQPLPPGHHVEGSSPVPLRPVGDALHAPRDAGVPDVSRSR